MSAPLWQPTLALCQSSTLYAFQKSLGFPSYEALYDWSIQEVGAFWSAVWDFCGVIGNKGPVPLENPEDIAKATFFPHGELNYAENLLQRQDDAIALYSYKEDHTCTTLTFRELHAAVSQWAQQLAAWGLQPGDCVAGYLPNTAHTVVATLATSALGGVWACCSPDFGISSVIDRLAQVEPKILFTVDGYYYNGKT